MMQTVLLVAALQIGQYGQGDCDNGQCAKSSIVASQSGPRRGAIVIVPMGELEGDRVVWNRFFSSTPRRGDQTLERRRPIARFVGRLFSRARARN